MEQLNQVNSLKFASINIYVPNIFSPTENDVEIIERYNILRSLHSYTKNTNIYKINKIEEFYNFEESEQKIIDIFLIENKNKILKWYPKFMCYIENDVLINDNNFLIFSL